MLTISLNEVELTALRATRGADRPWGVAEEAAMACRWLAARGLPFAGALLETLSTSTERRTALDFGIGLADEPEMIADRCPMLPGLLVAPLLLLPFLASVTSRSGGGFVVRWNDAAVALLPDRAAIANANGLAAAVATPTIVCVASGSTVEGRPLQMTGAGIAVDQASWSALQSLAGRTFVPESATSRHRGAGGAMTDVD